MTNQHLMKATNLKNKIMFMKHYFIEPEISNLFLFYSKTTLNITFTF